MSNRKSNHSGGERSYSQFRAMLAITRASFRSLLRSPSAIVFSVLFPFIFILVFGFIGGGSRITFKVGFHPESDTTSLVHQVLHDSVGLSIVDKPLADLESDLQRGRITAILKVTPLDTGNVRYHIDMRTSGAVNRENANILRSIIGTVILRFNEIIFPEQLTVAKLQDNEVQGRVYRTIDFILPGQLGFSLLSAGVFGVAFLFFNLRQALVLKRFFATPLHRGYIIVGEGLSRMLFQLLTAVVIISVGHFAFGFTLVNGWITFLELLILSMVGLTVFMGFGFIVSGLARNDAAIAPFSNLITLPQFLLAGTFFPIENFPGWLQPICRILPLTHLNRAMRDVAFEGAHLSECLPQLGILALWGFVAYACAILVFKWE